MTEQPLCSVVIATWNRRKWLEPAIASILAQGIADRVEIVVVDNGSTDDTIEWIRSTHGDRVRLFAYPENRGVCHARNAGVRLSAAPHVCFLDSDAEILSPDAIERCLAELRARSPRVRAVSGDIWFDRTRTNPFVLGGYISPDGHFVGRRSQTERDDPMFLSTCFAVWEKSLIEELGGFNPWYFWGIEDMDLGLRAHFNARRGATRAASRFALVEGVDILHEMAPEGRHYDARDFERKFASFERQRPYLVLSYGGVGEFLRVLARGPFRLGRMEESWQRRLTPWQKLRAAALFPALRLAMLPFDLGGVRADHLATTPMPGEITR